MADDGNVRSAYSWAAGDCFRCARGSVPTAQIAKIDTPSGDSYEIRACECCVLDLESERKEYAERRGLCYRPGGLGAP